MKVSVANIKIQSQFKNQNFVTLLNLAALHLPVRINIIFHIFRK